MCTFGHERIPVGTDGPIASDCQRVIPISTPVAPGGAGGSALGTKWCELGTWLLTTCAGYLVLMAPPHVDRPCGLVLRTVFVQAADDAAHHEGGLHDKGA